MVNHWLRRKAIDSAVVCNKNINKDPMMRLLLELTTAKYVLWMDDDSHFTDPKWFDRMSAFLDQEFDCAGHIFYMHKSKEYIEFLQKRPWWRGNEFFLEPQHEKTVWFATGGLWIAKTEFLKKHDFPDKKMIKKADDLLLGDLISQQHGNLIGFSAEILASLKISDGNRRGDGEDDQAWQ